MKELFKIETVTAFVADDTEGEGVLGAMMPDGVMMPLVCADSKRVESMYPIAVNICRLTGKRLKVLQFSLRTDITEAIHKLYGEPGT